MAMVRVCDVCGKQSARQISVDVGSYFDGVESTTAREYFDLCHEDIVSALDHIKEQMSEMARRQFADWLKNRIRK